jgi:serine protease Do
MNWAVRIIFACTAMSFFSGTLRADTPAAVQGGAAQATPSGEPFPPATPQNVVAVTRRVFPAVVRIDAARPTFVDGHVSYERGIGSGVIIDAAGRVLTNFHVAGGGTDLQVTLFNKERVKAKLIGDDHWTDLAVLQMNMDEIRQKKIDFSFAQLGDSSLLVPGQSVMAIGTPFGLARTLTLGTVSNVERTLYPDTLKIDDYETGGYSNWIQMDVPINPGNSGGPLVDLAGFVVGINTRGGAQNLNFAIPINTAKPVIACILKTASTGKVGHMLRADLGMEFKPMQDMESFYKLNPNQGVLVDDVSAFSAAHDAGVQPQDVLLAIDGVPTNARFPEELAAVRQMIARLPVGKPVQLELQRGSSKITPTATPTKLLGAIGEEVALSDWGLSVREVTPSYAAAKQLPSVAGVAVTGVTPDSSGAKAGLQIGDVIMAIDAKEISDFGAFESAHTHAMDTRRTQLMLSVQSDLGRRVVLLNVTPAASTQPTTKQ